MKVTAKVKDVRLICWVGLEIKVCELAFGPYFPLDPKTHLAGGIASFTFDL